ncbi:hypothetical protein [Pseudacidovorax intermedius]|uniref:hypothetical protein n=1 Tax=Pseudacidovorax intermedius TaxID=433924 RepID=UPI00128F8CF4|nr:hypothetical protein [Pseudacidovorax intermedius]
MRRLFPIFSALFLCCIFLDLHADPAKLITQGYVPVSTPGAYDIHTSFDACKMKLAVPNKGRIWFDGDWSVFIDQGKQKTIKKNDAHILRSRVSWSVEPPKKYDNYWVWISCDPPDDPQGLVLDNNADPCTLKNFVANPKSALLDVRQSQGLPMRAVISKNESDYSFAFCFYNSKQAIIGGGETKNGTSNIESIKSIIESISIDDGK